MKRIICGLFLLLALAAMPAQAQTCVPGGGVSCTPNLGLWVPPYGYPNWNVAVNANWSTLDTASSNWYPQYYVLSGETISHALARLPAGAGQLNVPCGTYSDNVTITTSNIRISAPATSCVTVTPAVSSNPVFSINATGTSGINYTELDNLTITCPANTQCGDGVLITGDNTIGQANDWINLNRLLISGQGSINSTGAYGFLNGINITGRTIWSNIFNTSVQNNRGNGINLNLGTNVAVNDLNIYGQSRVAGNYNYGISITSTNTVNPPESINLVGSNVEYNGNNHALPNCAGMYVNDTFSVNVSYNTFENNCVGNTADSKYASLRFSGGQNSYNQSHAVYGNRFNVAATSPEWAYYNDTDQTTGSIDGNSFFPAGHAIYIAVGPTASSKINIGTNFGVGIPSINSDVNGLSHVSMTSPFGTDYSLTSNISANTLVLNGSQNTAFIEGTNYTINNITPQAQGQRLLVYSLSSGIITVNYQHGGSGQIYGIGLGLSGTLANSDSMELISDGASWHIIQNNLYGAALTGTPNTFVYPQTMNQGILVPNNLAAVSMANNANVQCPILQSDNGNNYAIGDFANCMTGGTFIFWFAGQNEMDLNSTGLNILNGYNLSLNNIVTIPTGTLGHLGTGYVQFSDGSHTLNDCVAFGAGGALTDAGAPCGGTGSFILTTTGSSGAATFAGGTLNIPVYSAATQPIKCNVNIPAPGAIGPGLCAPLRGSSPAQITSCSGFTSAAAVQITAQASYVNTTGWSPALTPITPVVYPDAAANTIDYYLCNQNSVSVSPSLFGARMIITP